MPERILIIDDDASLRSFLATILREQGYMTFEAGNAESGLKAMDESEFHLVFLDLRLPGMSGMEALKRIRAAWPRTRAVMMTAYAEVDTAVEAMKMGASDYLTKPFGSPDEIRILAARIFEHERASNDLESLSSEASAGMPPPEVIFHGSAMAEVLKLARSVAPTTATVLVTGESGTGKELVARAVHAMSPRGSRPMVAVHCAALSEHLLESELFGHEKGAFTGAIQTRRGRFELADGGTLFLDEIGEIDQSVQVKLLRVLQERRFERVGGSRTLDVDVRLIAATNRDLDADARAGRFRNDLYYRLNVFPLHLPALRERAESMPALAGFFARKYGAMFGKPGIAITSDAMDALLGYDWPGNVRELENIIERAVIIAEETITAAMIPLRAPAYSAARLCADSAPLREREREAIMAMLKETGGNRTLAAERLGISRRTLQYRLKEYGVG